MLLPMPEAWCRNPGCDLHGMGLDDADIARCPACGMLLATEDVRVPAQPPVAQEPAEAAA
ncbi:MAG TPA: hypothetical protein VGR28_13195 [Candidatus Thermoplasmatota archaeon]|jgi:hypothetical protein|nr:hypothetical protein [Candidatus Thermoplasmatota archaeon]